MKVAVRWCAAALMAAGLAAGLVLAMSPAQAGAAAGSPETAHAGRAAGQFEVGAPGAPALGLACPSATTCMAVASFAQGNPERPVLTGELWNGKSWTAEPIPVPAGAIVGSVSGVSCPSATVCMVVVTLTEGNPARPVLTGELWNGASWTAEPVPVPTGA